MASGSGLEDAWESVKNTLRSNHSQLEIPKIPWLEEWKTGGFEKYYVDLTIINENEEARPLHLHDIFNSVTQSSREHPTRILIEGPAGYGKSTLARKLCFDHAKEESYIRHFDAVILLPLREFNDHRPLIIDQMIIDTYNLKNMNRKLMSDILRQNQSKILLILDGLDELPEEEDKEEDEEERITFIPLLNGKHYPQSTIIVMSRYENMELDSDVELDGVSSVTNLLQWADSRISVRGITGENKVNFLQSYLIDYSSEKCDSFIKLTDKKFGLSKAMGDNLFDCPLYLLLLVIVAEETDLASLTSKTQLYKEMFNFILRRMLAKEGQVDQKVDFFDFSYENPPAYVEMLYQFGSFVCTASGVKRYPFTKEKILRVCGNDGSILRLGILTQNESKIGPSQKSWFEPLHFSFLEFAYAYSIWVGCVLPSFKHFYASKAIKSFLNGFCKTLTTSFVCGLCWKQLPKLLPDFTGYTMMGLVDQLDLEEMMAESQLELNELGQVLLPLIPVVSVVTVHESNVVIPILLKEALTHAVQTSSRNQRINFERQYSASKQHQGSWLKATACKDSKSEIPCLETIISQEWRELITSQKIDIRNPDDSCIYITFTIREAPLQKQLNWLSDFITIEGVSINKPVHTIYYECPSENVPKLIESMTELIQQERVRSVKVYMFECRVMFSAESWTEFIHRANESMELLDMSLDYKGKGLPLVVNLTPAKGKQWRNVELKGKITLSVGTKLFDASGLNGCNLDSFIRGLPSNIQALKLDSALFGMFRNDSLPTAHNVEELSIIFNNSNLSLLQSSVLESLKNLKVLTIKLDNGVKLSERDLATFVRSVTSHCHSLLRLELGRYCTEQFLQGLDKDKWTDHLNTLMIPADDLWREASLITSNVANVAKDALQTRYIKRLWVEFTEFHGKKIIKCTDLFSSAEGFKIRAVDKQSWSKGSWPTLCMLEVSVK